MNTLSLNTLTTETIREMCFFAGFQTGTRGEMIGRLQTINPTSQRLALERVRK